MDELTAKVRKLEELWWDYQINTNRDIGLLHEIEKLYSDIFFACLGKNDIEELIAYCDKIDDEIRLRRWDLLKYEVRLFLDIPQIKRSVQMWWYYRHLADGTDVVLGGWEYATIENAKDKGKAYEVLIKMYDELAIYEKDIRALMGKLNGFDIWLRTDDEVKDIVVLDGILKEYHKEVEYIRDLILEERKPQQPIKTLPKELDTDEAKKWLSKTIEKGFMTDGYQWAKETTRYQIAMWVEIASERLGIKNKWKWAENIWGLKDLAQTRNESKDRFGKVEREKDIEACFE